ncbi:MAG: PQQ-binding-like beta-propeller repeat protein [Armatimonadota bacterium]
MRVNRLLAIIACLTVAAAVFAADWPVWLGPNQDGTAPDTGINKDWNNNPPEKLWQVQMHDGGYAGPSVADGKVFIIDHEGQQDVVRAIDLETGDDVWECRYNDLEKANYGFSRSTPVYHDGRLYTVSFKGNVACIDAETGEIVWGVNMPGKFGGVRPTWGYAMSALIDGDRLIIVPGGENACVAALDRMTGEVIWTGGGSDIPGYATPVKATIEGTSQYVVFTGKSVIGVDVEDGSLLWRVPWETSHDVNAATPIVSGNHVFITSNYKRGCAVITVGENGADITWETKGMWSHFNTPVYHDGYLYGPSNPNLVCLDPSNGEQVWTQSGFERGGVCLVDGVILALSGNQGFLAMVEATPDGYNELGRFTPLGGQSWTAPIVADGKLIVRNKEALACFDLM